MDLEPGDTEGHHHIGHGMGLGKQVTDLGQGLDVPVGHIVGSHGLLPAVLKAVFPHLALSHRLHDLEGHLGLQPHLDEVEHNVIPAAHCLQNGGRTVQDEVPGVAQPHIGAVREAGQTNQRVEVGGIGVHKHLTGELGVELGDGHSPSGAQYRVVGKAQLFRGGEQAHGVLIVQPDVRPGVHTRQVLQHPDHGGVIVAQHVQLQQVGLHGVVFKVGGDDVGARVVGGVLHRAEVVNLPVLGDDHHAAGMLAGGPFGARTALGQPLFLGPGGGDTPLFQVLLHIAIGRFLGHRADGPRPEHMALAKELKGVAVGPGLVLAGEIQVDIGHLVASEAQKGLEGDIKAVLHIGGPAHRADGIGHIRPAAVPMGGAVLKVSVLTFGAAVVGTEGIDLGDAREEGHDRGAHRAPGAHQIAVLQGVLHQLLGRHVNDIVLSHDDAGQLQINSVLDDLGQFFPVKLVGLVIDQPLQLLVRVLQLGGKEALGQRVQLLDPVSHQIGIADDHVIAVLLPQIAELLQHLLGGLEIDGQGFIAILKALGVQQDVTVNLLLGVQKVNVACGTHRPVQGLAQLHNGPVKVLQHLHIGHLGLPVFVWAEHKEVVAQGLDFQVIVPGGHPFQLLPLPLIGHRLVELTSLTGRAQNQSLPIFLDLAFQHERVAAEVLQMGVRDQAVEIAQALLVFGQHNEMVGSGRPLALGHPFHEHRGHGRIDGGQGGDALLLQHLEHGDEHLPHHLGVIAGPVVLEGRQVQSVGHRIQLVIAKAGQQAMAQGHRVQIGIGKLLIQPAAGLGDKTGVK